MNWVISTGVVTNVNMYDLRLSHAVTTKNVVFWDVALYISWVNRRFGGTYRLHLQGRKIRERWTGVRRWLQLQLRLSSQVFSTLLYMSWGHDRIFLDNCATIRYVTARCCVFVQQLLCYIQHVYGADTNKLWPRSDFIGGEGWDNILERGWSHEEYYSESNLTSNGTCVTMNYARPWSSSMFSSPPHTSGMNHTTSGSVRLWWTSSAVVHELIVLHLVTEPRLTTYCTLIVPTLFD
jgi:hypothetical protein